MRSIIGEINIDGMKLAGLTLGVFVGILLALEILNYFFPKNKGK